MDPEAQRELLARLQDAARAATTARHTPASSVATGLQLRALQAALPATLASLMPPGLGLPSLRPAAVAAPGASYVLVSSGMTAAPSAPVMMPTAQQVQAKALAALAEDNETRRHRRDVEVRTCIKLHAGGTGAMSLRLPPSACAVCARPDCSLCRGAFA